MDLKKAYIKAVTEKDVWEGFLGDVGEKTFLQSWNWGEFQKALGEKVWRLGVFREGELVAVAQVVMVKAKRGRFLLLPHGPLLASGDPKSKIRNPKEIQNSKIQILKALLQELKKIAGQERCHFIRVAPVWQRGEEGENVFKQLGFKGAPIHIHPELTWQLDLAAIEEELLKNMRKTTRYLIKQGLKDNNLTIEKSQDVKSIEVFNQIYQSTAQRHKFVPFSLDYLKKEFLAFQKGNQALVFLAKYKGECLAAALIIFWQGIGFYHQGASSQKYAKVPASYLLQWQAVKEAKKRGCRLYNFWGIADVEREEELKKHPWWGLTLFKKGFGGHPVFYLKTQDLPLSQRYWLTYLFERLRKKKRGF